MGFGENDWSFVSTVFGFDIWGESIVGGVISFAVEGIDDFGAVRGAR